MHRQRGFPRSESKLDQCAPSPLSLSHVQQSQILQTEAACSPNERESRLFDEFGGIARIVLGSDELASASRQRALSRVLELDRDQLFDILRSPAGGFVLSCWFPRLNGIVVHLTCASGDFSKPRDVWASQQLFETISSMFQPELRDLLRYAQSEVLSELVEPLRNEVMKSHCAPTRGKSIAGHRGN